MEVVKTREYGTIEVPKNSSVIFKKPIFGFNHLIEYYLIPLEEPQQFMLLQSKDDEDISFIVTQPRLFVSDYVLDIDDKDVELLEITDHLLVVDFAIVTIPEDTVDITMNILGPIVINSENRYAVQSISNCAHYATKCGLFSNPQESSQGIMELIQQGNC